MIARYLDLSTGHLTRRELDTAARVLEEVGPRVIPHEYGLWVNVAHDDIEKHDNELTSVGFTNMLAAVRVARTLGWDVNWINFDADGATWPGLPLAEPRTPASTGTARVETWEGPCLDVRPCDCPQGSCSGCCKNCGAAITWRGGWTGQDYEHADT